MKNNQFKRVIREYIETCCEENNVIPVYVDISNNERVCYLYNKEYTPLGTLNMYLTNTDVRLRYSKNIDKVVSICHKDIDTNFSYLNLKQCLQCIDKMFKAVLIKTKRTK